jgi:hypothetical protein
VYFIYAGYEAQSNHIIFKVKNVIDGGCPIIDGGRFLPDKSLSTSFGFYNTLFKDDKRLFVGKKCPPGGLSLK